VKLSDFGIARSLERHGGTTSGVVRGKIPYIAPERLRGESYDHRVDLFALGVVLYEVATGSLPFEAETEAGMMLRMLEGRMADGGLLRAAAPDLAPIVVALLDKDPAGRPRDAGVPRAQLLPLRDETSAREVLSARATAVRAAEPPHETRKVRRRRNV
jgi:eukaryotic-like serine/threonine-protein kinase